jgi:Transposase DDE domain
LNPLRCSRSTKHRSTHPNRAHNTARFTLHLERDACFHRADAGFANPEIYEYLEAEGIKYAIRLPANRVLQERIGYLLKRPVGRPSNDVRREHYPVRVVRSPCNLGGSRAWFICPAVGCGRRVAILYGGGIFACRRCYRLAYASAREDVCDRAARRADRLRARLV